MLWFGLFVWNDPLRFLSLQVAKFATQPASVSSVEVCLQAGAKFTLRDAIGYEVLLQLRSL